MLGSVSVVGAEEVGVVAGTGEEGEGDGGMERRSPCTACIFSTGMPEERARAL